MIHGSCKQLSISNEESIGGQGKEEKFKSLLCFIEFIIVQDTD